MEVLQDTQVDMVVKFVSQNKNTYGRIISTFNGKVQVLTTSRDVIILNEDKIEIVDNNYMTSVLYNKMLFDFMKQDKLICPICRDHFISIDIWDINDYSIDSTCNQKKEEEIRNMFNVLKVSFKDVKRHNSIVFYNKFSQLKDTKNKNFIIKKYNRSRCTNYDLYRWICSKFIMIYPYLTDDYRHKIYELIGNEIL